MVGEVSDHLEQIGLPSHVSLDAVVTVEFACKRRNGSYVVIPAGRCQIDVGSHFAAICWERRNGRNRAEVPLDKLIEFLNAERIAIRTVDQP
jgi:hypothetical protein